MEDSEVYSCSLRGSVWSFLLNLCDLHVTVCCYAGAFLSYEEAQFPSTHSLPGQCSK